MSHNLRTVTMSLAVMLVVAGVCMMVFGAILGNFVVIVQGMGPLDGSWGRSKYFFIGGFVATLGSGLLTYAIQHRRI